MEFIETTKGGRKLSKDWLLYIKNKTLTNRRTYWECAQRPRGNSCNVKTTLDAADRFVAQTHQHTHAADPAIVNTSKKCIVTFGNIHAVVRTLEI